VRGFRPSRFGSNDEAEDVRENKEHRVRTYTERARAGLPLFDETSFVDRITEYGQRVLRQT